VGWASRPPGRSTKAVGEAEAEKLLAAVTAERERVEKARQEAIEKSKQVKAKTD
jgi:hypothetical protein